MTLAAGQSLTHYEILGPLGAGGMGEVYRARDTRLDREVAIKVLPEELSDDEERLRRFEREAKTLASLNHTNVAGIHGVDQEGDVCFLALELVPGEDLATRLARGPLPVDEAIDACRQIAEGLEAAHEAGVVHRDLKPANVRVTPEGVVKILDFGLAKPIHARATQEGTTTAESDSFLMTEEGVVLGTPTYMSPEQARGKPVDRRTDIWAFGCVMYECLTGRRAFAGGSLTDVLAAIVEREPDWSLLPAAVPADARRLLRRCLLKDPRVRLRDVGEARVVLAGDADVEDPGDVPVRAKGSALAFVAGLVVAGFAWLVVTLLRPDVVVGPDAADKAFHMTVAWGRGVFPLSISPDGNRLLCVQQDGLSIRDLAEPEPRLLPGTDGIDGLSVVEWSPDGDSIAFLRDGSLEILRLGGTRPERRCDLGRRASNISWGDDGSFLFEIRGAPTYGIHLLAPDSSTVEHLDWLDTKGRVLPDHAHPSFLPGSEEFLVTLGEEGGAWIHVASLETRSTRRLVRGSSMATYVHPGWLAWVDEGRLLVQAFDAATASLSGAPHELAGNVANFASSGHAYFSFSREGTLSYLPWGGPSRIEWVDREGRPQGPAGEPRRYADVRVDPTGRLLATSITTPETGFKDLWIIDLERDTPERLTHEIGWESTPIWSPDGMQIAFSADWYGPPNLFVKPADGGETRELVPFDLTVNYGGSWTPDGGSLVYSRSEAGESDLWSVDVNTLERRRLLETPFNERDPQLSPDGRWLAYSSDESGRREVYVAAFPGLAGRRRVSSAGGDQPRWRSDSKELFFRTGDRAIASVAIAVREGRAEPDRETIVIQASNDLNGYDVMPDGSRFLLLRASEDDSGAVSHVVTHWQRLLAE